MPKIILLFPFVRMMLGLAAVPSIVMFFGCIVLPESPRWLVSKGFSDRAKKVLEKLRGTEDVSVELEDIKMVCDEEEALLRESKCDPGGLEYKKRWRCSSRILKLTPNRDKSGRGSRIF